MRDEYGAAAEIGIVAEAVSVVLAEAEEAGVAEASVADLAGSAEEVAVRSNCSLSL